MGGDYRFTSIGRVRMNAFFAMGSTNLTILAVCVLVMLYLAWYDNKTLSDEKEEHSDQKSVIVSIGVLGTFIGIVLGLLAFNADNIKDSIPPLLNGLKFAFLTSIAGMLISIFVSFIQKKKVAGGDDQLEVLKRINEKLDGLSEIGSLKNEVGKLRTELRDEQEKSRKASVVGFSEITNKLEENKLILEQQVTSNDLAGFRNEVHDKQTESQTFFREQFGKTNESLEKAIEALSKGATEEIIKALETVISDFNQNLVDQFGDNFKQLNSAVKELLVWQEQYKEMLTNDQKYLETISTSIDNSKDTLEVVASKNTETQAVYSQLADLIKTYDTQISSVNQQLVNYVQVGEKAVAAFSSLEDGFAKVQSLQEETVRSLSSGFENIQSGITAQSDASSTLSNELKGQLPESLGKLESTLVGLTNQFASDYQAFLENYRNLIPKV